MSYFVVDVEADGPVPGLYSMVSFGAVVVREGLRTTFYGKLRPDSELWIPESLAISGHSREECLTFDPPKEVMSNFESWITENSKGRPIFISDNLAFDWMFIAYYFHKFIGKNPFGFSGRRIGDLYCGMQKDSFAKWKHLRKTAHTHHPVDDAVGNAEAIMEMKRLGLNISLL